MGPRRSILGEQRELVGIMLVVAYVATLLLAPVATAQRMTGVAIVLASVVVQAVLWRVRGDDYGPPTLLGAIDAAAGLALAMLVPDLALLGLGLILLAVVRATALGGVQSGLPVFACAEVGVLVPALVTDGFGADGDGGWGAFIGVVHPLLTLSAMLTVGLAVYDRDRLTRRLNLSDEALAAFADASVDGDSHEAIEAAVRALLPGASVLAVSIGTAGDADAPDLERLARSSGSPLVRLRREEEGLCSVVALPMRPANTVVGVVTVRLPSAPDPEVVEQLDVLMDRLSAAVVAEAAHERERAARMGLEAAEQLRDEVLARVTHDLRAPLSTITGSVFTLTRYADRLSPPDVRKIYELLGRNADRVTNWVQSLLEGAMMGEIAEVDPRPCNLLELLDDGRDTAAEQLADHHVRLEGPDLQVDADPVATTRVLANLLGNAAKYAPKGSVIDVRASLREDEVTVAVVDRGPGISEEDAKHVFEPFFRSQEQPEGVTGIGLGLATVRQLVLSWGGRLGVSQTPGGGATFWFTMPVSEVLVPSDRRMVGRGVADRRATPRVVVDVEDAVVMDGDTSAP